MRRFDDERIATDLPELHKVRQTVGQLLTDVVVCCRPRELSAIDFDHRGIAEEKDHVSAMSSADWRKKDLFWSF